MTEGGYIAIHPHRYFTILILITTGV